MIDINNLNFKYHKYKQIKVVNNISFNIKKGELVCLLGPSGCGKTSTLRLIAGLETPSSGSIYIEGKCVTDDNTFIEPHKRGIGFLFQDFALFPHLTAQENIAWGLSGIGHIDKKFKIEELLKQTSLIEHKNKYPHELSGGEQQRVSLARALAPGPNLILLDEPFSSLDTNLRQYIRDETSRILKETDTTAIVVTHDPEEAMLIADKIILMNKGEIQQEGTAHEIYNNPKNNFVASFLGYVNQIEGIVRNDKIETIMGPIPNQNFSNNSSVSIIIRPRAISFSNKTPNDSRNKYAKIDSIKSIGAEIHTWLRLGTNEENYKKILSIQDQKPNLTKGDRVKINIDQKNIFIFKENPH